MRKNPLSSAVAVAVAVAATACLALTACGPGGGGTARPSATAPASTATPGSGSAAPGSGAGPAAQPLGTPSRTVGAGLVGILEITPTTVVHARTAKSTVSRFGTFAVITTKDASLTSNAADEEPAGANGAKGGWRWLCPDGQSVAEGNGAAHQVSVAGYDGAGRIEPGTSQLRSEVFDLTPAQAGAGGTLVYTDATGEETRWKVPAGDAGPGAADVRKRLAS
ncbi:hypothetical protein [Streptomyces sp. NPDC048111]|uniref:hypothetical protein n=1 Tax=Streptomyces sp. NPDC048111 TaxID=3365500 RepID=UPI00371825B2